MKVAIGRRKLESILYRENSIIAAEDVPLLVDVLCGEAKVPTPKSILREIEAARKARNE
jgi:hypothetical protein